MKDLRYSIGNFDWDSAELQNFDSISTAET